MLDKLIQEKRGFTPKKSKRDASYRSCTEELYNFVFTGGFTMVYTYKTGVRTKLNRVIKVNSKTIEEEGILASMNTDRCGHKTIYCKGEIYTIYGHDNDDQKILTIEK